MKTTVLGAAGAIGKTVTRTLVSREMSVRVVGRSEQRLREVFAAQPVEYVAADLATAAGCRRALEGMDAAIYSLGLPYTKSAFSAYPRMMRTCLEGARHCKLKKFILITNVYPYGIPETERVAEAHPRRPVSVKGQYRKEQEDLVLAAHEPDGLHTLSVRLPDFYGPDTDKSIVDGLFEAAVCGKKANLLGPIDTPHEFVFTPDVGPMVADLLNRPEAFGGAYNFAGSGVLSIKELAERVYSEAGVGKTRYRVAQGMVLRLLGIFTPLLRELVEMEYLLRTPVLLDDSKLRTVLPDLKKTPYEEGIRQTVAEYRRRANAT